MEEPDDIRQMAQHFEAVKIALTQDKNGFVLRLSLHPNDAPEELLRDPVGQRYVVALVRTNDQSEPVPSQSQQEGSAAVRLAGTLSTDEQFQGWLCIMGMADELGEEPAAIAIREHCGVISRKELKTNKDARKKLYDLRDEFVTSMKRR